MNRVPASPGGRGAVDRWLATVPGGAALVEHVAYSPILSTSSFTPGRGELDDFWLSGAWVSWFGGPCAASTLPWPRDGHGSPLAHVATVHLAELASAADERSRPAWYSALRDGLPTDGLLEVFHDLRSDGFDDGASSSGWSVRWVADGQPRGLVEPPAAQPDGVVCALAAASFTVPPRLDPPFTDVSDIVWTQLLGAWTGPEARDDATGFSYAYGHSRFSYGAVAEQLADRLPLEEADEHRLVLSLEPPLDGWLPPGVCLEIWMRESDVVAARFDAAWCLLRSA